jgi:hypothetical protein
MIAGSFPRDSNLGSDLPIKAFPQVTWLIG